MGNEDGKRILDNLFLVIKGEKVMFVDSDLYKQLKDLKSRSRDLYDVYTFINGNDSKYRLAYWWLHCNDSNSENRLHEKNMLDWLAGTLEIKPEPEKKYKVYQSLGRDGGSDEWFTGIYRNNYLLSIISWCENPDEKFTVLTKSEIKEFQDRTGIKFPQSAWHEINYEMGMSF